MIHHVWSVLCEQVLSNPKTKDLSLINILHKVPITSADKERNKITIAPCIIVSKWYKNADEEDSLSFKVTIRDENDDVYETVTGKDLSLKKGTSSAVLTIEVTEMVVDKEGDYFFEIFMKQGVQKKYRLAAKLPFIVSLPRSQDSPPAPNPTDS